MLFDNYVNKKIRVFLKNGIKYEGILLRVDGNFLVLDDKKIGEVGINITNISDFKEVV